ncbi:MAG: hypothetical protein IPJ55_13900 [Chloracidobacterium sp.]|nr:hypothetical protein [Chloracidobacterium sp.]
MKTLALFAIFLGLVPFIAAQTLPEQIAKVEKPKDVSFTYDKFKDVSRVQVKGVSFGTKDNRTGIYSIGVEAYFDVPGQSLTDNVETFYILFRSFNRDWLWLHDSNLIMLIDGKRTDLGPASMTETCRWAVSMNGCGLRFRVETYERIVHANTLELQLGAFAGEITNRTLARTTRKLKELLEVSTKPQSR